MIIKGVPLATNKRSLRQRPKMDYATIQGQGKPTLVNLGCYSCYSLPVWSSDNEEIFFQTTIPRRWDGASDVKALIQCALAGAEDVGDKFKLQLSWSTANCNSAIAIPTATTDPVIEQDVLTSRSAQYSVYEVTIILDFDGPSPAMAVNDKLGLRLRRIASGSPAITGELIILGLDLQYNIDKAYGPAS